jgi:hypothetical protein
MTTLKEGSEVDTFGYERLVVAPSECETLKLLTSANLFFSEEKGRYFVLWPHVNEFGAGDSLSEALADVFLSAHNFYIFLLENEHRLGPSMRETLRNYREVIA